VALQSLALEQGLWSDFLSHTPVGPHEDSNFGSTAHFCTSTLFSVCFLFVLVMYLPSKLTPAIERRVYACDYRCERCRTLSEDAGSLCERRRTFSEDVTLDATRGRDARLFLKASTEFGMGGRPQDASINARGRRKTDPPTNEASI
jgi:hypothetical protein